MVRSWSVGASIGGAVLAAILLAGCGTGGDDAAASPSSVGSAGASDVSSATAAPSPAATPADYVPASLEGPAQNVPEPVMPDLAQEESRDGAQAFLDYWSDAKWYAYQTGDTSYAREIISPSCMACMEELDEIGNLYQAAAWAIGGRETIKIQDKDIVSALDGVYKPVVSSAYEGIVVIDVGNAIHKEDPKEGGTAFQVYIDFSDGKWTYITAAPMHGAE